MNVREQQDYVYTNLRYCGQSIKWCRIGGSANEKAAAPASEKRPRGAACARPFGLFASHFVRIVQHVHRRTTKY